MESNGASQGTFSRVVKEDLKRIPLHLPGKYQSNRIVREQQIYGLTLICGNKAVTLPVQMDENDDDAFTLGHPGGPILKNLQSPALE